MEPLLLQQPVGALLKPVEPLCSFDSLQRAATLMQERGVPVYPVVAGAVLAAAVSEESLAKAVSLGHGRNSSVAEAFAPLPPSIRLHATGAEALRLLETSGSPALFVTDDAGRVLGILRPTDLLERTSQPIRPRMVGGMATPFGVYLTNGALRAGVGSLALMATGMLMFVLFLVSAVVASQLDPLLSELRFSASARDAATQLIAAGLFLIGLRAMPLAGIHAAEHMVVHAIEREEDLTPEVVGRMPRVHPRCGTNIATAAVLFLSLATTDWIGVHPSERQLQVLLAALVTLSVWRPLGSAAQYYITTKPPTPKQIDLGIMAGKQLLERYRGSQFTAPSVPKRIWYSGMPQLVAGSLLVSALFEALVRFVPFLKGLQVYF